MGAQQQPNQLSDDMKDINLSNPQQQPKDTISDIQFSPNCGNGNYIFATACWDGKISIMNIAQQGNQSFINQLSQLDMQSPVLGMCWKGDASMIYAVCADGSVKVIDTNTSQFQKMFDHQGVFWIGSVTHNGQEFIITCGFDKNLKFWQYGNPNPLFTHPIGATPFAACVSYP